MHNPPPADSRATVLETAVCPVCASEGTPVYTQRDLFCGLEGEFGQRYCSGCAMYFLSPRVPEVDIGRYYPQNYGPYIRREDTSVVKGLAGALGLPGRRRRIVERYGKGGRILDVGCGAGDFLELFDTSRWERYATDVSRQLAPAFECRFHTGPIDGTPPPFPRMDVITLWHVFEHLYHPRRALKNAFDLLQDNGTLFLAIPDLRCLERVVFGKYWAGWDPPRHIATYSAKGLGELLDGAGMRIVDVVADACSSDLLALNAELALRAVGIQARLRRSLIVRAALYPAVFASIGLGLAPAKVYVAQKR